MRNYTERAIELFKTTELSTVKIAKKVAEEFNFNYNDSFRKKISYLYTNSD